MMYSGYQITVRKLNVSIEKEISMVDTDLKETVAKYYEYDIYKPFWIHESTDDGFPAAPALNVDVEFFDVYIINGVYKIVPAKQCDYWQNGVPCGTDARFVVYGTKRQ